MSSFPKLFSNIKIGTVELRNRVVMPAMCTNFPVDGKVTQRMIDYFVERARGQAGLIIPEATAVIAPPEGRLAKDHLIITDDSQIPFFKKLTDAVHAFNVRIAVQLSHFGRQMHSGFYGAEIFAPSPIPCPVNREIPKELSIEEIESVIESFVQGARRAYEAGFDLVEIHGSHGYLISQFFSLRSNRRSDIYGGGSVGRSRFCVEIIKRIKENLGSSLPIIVRINGHDYIEGGAELKDMQEIAPLLVDAGADALSVSAGVYGSYKATVAPMFEREGCFVELAEGIKEVVNVPVITVGRINDPCLAEEILELNRADLIAVGRGLIADPEWPVKAMSGRVDDIRRCLSCNQGCIDRLNESMMATIKKEITCLVNPRVGKEVETQIEETPNPKRILVVGGGPAGLQTAFVAALRGHHVSLWEREKQLGGQLFLAGAVPGREEFHHYISFMERQIKDVGVEVIRNKLATLGGIMEYSPGVVICATGAIPIIPSFVKEGNKKVMTAWEILAGKVPPGERIIVLGGGAVGLETAHFLANKSKKVKILELTGNFGGDMGRIAAFYLRNILKREGVEMLKFSEVKEVKNDEVLFMKEGVETLLSDADAIVLALGGRSDNSLVGEISEKVPEVLTIGDASKPGKALEAIAEGFRIGKAV